MIASKQFEDAKARHRQTAQVYTPEEVPVAEIAEFISQHPYVRVVDEYDGLLEELFQMAHPSQRPAQLGYHDQLKAYKTAHYAGHDTAELGKWFYYPWRGALVHVLESSLHNQLRTNRNQEMITAEEQDKLRKVVVAVAGLSVGSSILTGLSIMSQYQALKIADADELSLSNMNRLYASITDLNIPKTTIAARAIYERDPEANVMVFAEGLNDANLNDFLDGVNIVFDEIDNIAMKAKIRLAARERGIPVIMVTDVGDSGILDIERYDLNQDQQLFHGRLTDDELRQVLHERPDHDAWLQLVAKIIGLEHVPSRLMRSFPFIGKRLAGAPQLGTAAMVSGGIGAFVARMIALGVPLNTGKIPLILEAELLKDYDKELATRRKLLKQLSKQSY